MKNKKAEIATLLTLGLVILGGVLAIGSSILVKNRNLAYKSKAAESSYFWGPADECYQKIGEWPDGSPKYKKVSEGNKAAGQVLCCQAKPMSNRLCCAPNVLSKLCNVYESLVTKGAVYGFSCRDSQLEAAGCSSTGAEEQTPVPSSQEPYEDCINLGRFCHKECKDKGTGYYCYDDKGKRVIDGPWCCPPGVIPPPAATKTPIPTQSVDGGVQCQSVNCPAGTTDGPYYTTKIKEYDWYYVNKTDCENKTTNCGTNCGVGSTGQNYIKNKVCRAEDQLPEVGEGTAAPVPSTVIPTLDVSGKCNDIPCGSPNSGLYWSKKCWNPLYSGNTVIGCGGTWSYFRGQGCKNGYQTGSESEAKSSCSSVPRPIHIIVKFIIRNLDIEPTKPILYFTISNYVNDFLVKEEYSLSEGGNFSYEPPPFDINASPSGLKYYIWYNPAGIDWINSMGGNIIIQDGKAEVTITI